MYHVYLTGIRKAQTTALFNHLNPTQLSQDIMNLFTGQMETAMTRMHFLIDPSLKQQLSYLKVQVKFQHMQELNQKFDNMKDDMIDDVQEQIEVFGSVYQ